MQANMESRILTTPLEPGKVSIIMPAYNCEDFIAFAIESVLAQTYVNWELIVVNDCSTDGTVKIVENFAQKDSRIKLASNEKNSGAAITRNNAIAMASGQYLAFLDSDDLWKPEKLEKQLNFMKEKGCTFSCTSYGKVDESGNFLNYVVSAEKKSDYFGVLKNCPGNSTVVYDASVLGRHIIPDIKKRNDYVMWLSVIKKAGYIYGLAEVLGSHRVRSDSISANKRKLVKFHWFVYRKIENLSLLKSIYLIAYWVEKGVILVLKRKFRCNI